MPVVFGEQKGSSKAGGEETKAEGRGIQITGAIGWNKERQSCWSDIPL